MAKVNTSNTIYVFQGESRIPLIMPGFSGANPFILNGAFAGITALDTTYSSGVYCYWPASTVTAAQTAGWYWTVFSTTSAGIVYTTQYTSGNPVAPTAPVAFSGAAGSTTAQIITAVQSLSWTIPANALGTTGQILMRLLIGGSNDSNSKFFTAVFGGTSFWSTTTTTSPVSTLVGTITNQNSAAAQISNQHSDALASTVFERGTVNTVNAQALSLQIQLAAATSYISVQNGTIQAQL